MKGNALRHRAFRIGSAALTLSTKIGAVSAAGFLSVPVFQALPESWALSQRVFIVAAAAAVISAKTYTVLGDYLVPVRRLLARVTARPQPCQDRLTLAEAIRLTATAAKADAAARAAIAAFTLDRSDHFLRNPRGWHGSESGEAAFPLGPGVTLHYDGTDPRLAQPQFSLTILGKTPVAVSTLPELLALLTHLAHQAAPVVVVERV
ncbi:hypothetical protein OIE69_43925 (plasmid) [Actinacidiphila glaucinigra]|uniref:hypothetical protein n=1 Tax=Actinacidiphila glaucinigra TaxID=235986 RepID=UPI002DD8C4BB|nr:hypothetical protein [Actinacidiphila glaucinigra]WSD65854.1 hypothetical protein OIE69_43925 [Actinacidiphila glaucinigra]